MTCKCMYMMRLLVVAFVVAVMLAYLSSAPAQSIGAPAAAPPPRPVSVDVDGLRLPDGAIARLGSTRFRHPVPVEHCACSPDGKVLLWDVYGLHKHDIATHSNSLASAWDDLQSRDAGIGFRAVRTLAASGADGLALLRSRMTQMKPLDEEQIGRWISELDSEDYNTREKASNELAKFARLIKPRLLAASAATKSPEVAQRIYLILKDAPRPIPTELQVCRAVEAAELIGSHGAMELLNSWAAGEKTKLLTRESHAAILRLKK
jgi:hypothetical protein